MKRLASVGVSRETRSRLEIFAAEVRRWNPTINLVSPADTDALESRHIEDCLQLVPFLPPERDAGAIDLGSGAGFPGLVLAIVTGRAFVLVEADKRKAAFLREAARLTAAPVTVHAGRIESADLRPAALVTARALARLDVLLQWTWPKLVPGGVALFLKGRGAEDELTQARRRWQMRVDSFPNRTGSDGVVLRISEISPVAPSS